MSVGKTRASENVEQTDFAGALREFAASVEPSAGNVNIRSVQRYGAGNARYCNIPADVADPQDDVMVAEFGGIVVIVPFGI